MKCIDHPEIDAVSTCTRCGGGLCKESVQGTVFQIDNKPLCRKCNFEVGCENDQLLKSLLAKKKVALIIFSTACVLGLLVYFIAKIAGANQWYQDGGLIVCWALGYIGAFFDDGLAKRLASGFMNGKNGPSSLKTFVISIIGYVLGFIIMALFSPIFVITYLIGFFRVKKQVAESDALLNAAKEMQ